MMSADAALPDCASRLAALRDPAVRDLAWLLFNPDLLQPDLPRAPLARPWESEHELATTLAWLETLERAPHALHRALAGARLTRLGRYAEALLGWFLVQGPTARLVAANVALRHAGRTLGECDFLLETGSGKRLHWELAVKCYLHAGEGRGLLADFVGPNLLDRFDLKRAHLLDHQLPLSARDEFASLGLQGPWHAQMFVKGWLFHEAPAHTTQPDALELAPGYPRGWWVTRSAWSDFAAAEAAHWCVLPRLAWLAPRRVSMPDDPAMVADASTLPEATLLTSIVPGALSDDPAELLRTIARPHEPVMVAAFDAQGADHVERSRGFIVPDDWPERARSFARR